MSQFLIAWGLLAVIWVISMILIMVGDRIIQRKINEKKEKEREEKIEQIIKITDDELTHWNCCPVCEQNSITQKVTSGLFGDDYSLTCKNGCYSLNRVNRYWKIKIFDYLWEWSYDSELKYVEWEIPRVKSCIEHFKKNERYVAEILTRGWQKI